MNKKAVLSFMLVLMVMAIVLELFYLARHELNRIEGPNQEVIDEVPEEIEVEEIVVEPEIDPTEWNLLLVNPWNAIPDSYLESLETAETESGYEVHALVKEDLEKMLADCREAGGSPEIISVTYLAHQVEPVLNTSLVVLSLS